MKKNTKTKATKTNTKSLKGEWGQVGAPPKTVKYPKTRFTVERAVAMNPNVCELTVRNRIKEDLANGKLVKSDEIRQPKKGVGRPKFSFILKELVSTTVPVAKVTPTKAKVTPPEPVIPVAPVTPVVTATDDVVKPIVDVIPLP